MFNDARRPLTLEALAADPLTRMVMDADGVSLDEFLAVWHAARDAVVARRVPPATRAFARRPAMSVPA